MEQTRASKESQAMKTTKKTAAQGSSSEYMTRKL